MSCPQCIGIEQSFDDARARMEMTRYRTRGPRKTTRLLIEGVKEAGAAGRSLLDIGGGVGAVHLGLLAAGVSRAVDVDASSAYLRAAKAEAENRGLADRVTYRFGNFADLAGGLPPEDIVALDRVVCCYHDIGSLLGASVLHASSILGMVFPRDTWWGKLVNGLLNLNQRVKGSPFRTFVHPYSRIQQIVGSSGLASFYRRRTLFWQVEVFRRSGPS